MKRIEHKLAEPFHDPRLGEDLLWRELRVQPFLRPVPALFLDRDGVIIAEKIYLSRPDDVELLPGIPELIRAARARDMAVIEITNQAGISHGYFRWQDFVQVEKRISDLLARDGVAIDAVFACPFHERGQFPYIQADHPWRKPKPGMILEAGRLLNLDLKRSILVGDKSIDLEAGRAAGLAVGVHVLTGHGLEHADASRAVASPNFSVHVVERADEVVPYLNELRVSN
jgi:D-glycero-D-manno-heptose 1,7-bisphosphate phosphatase